jgi:hypothetical protein
MSEWFYSAVMLVLLVASIGVIVSLPQSYQNPVLYIIPFLFFIALFVTLGIK